jgi:predicted nucleotidyltransferase
MAEIPDLVYSKVTRFLELLKSNNIHVEKAYLFGSIAKGNFNKWSDIDLAVVSDDFSGDRLSDRLSLIDYVFIAGHDISPLPFRSEDFSDSMFARDEILKYGIEIDQS